MKSKRKTKDNRPLSKYMNKTIKDIKFHDDFKPIFFKEGIHTYTKEELKKMKTTRKETNFRDIKNRLFQFLGKLINS